MNKNAIETIPQVNSNYNERILLTKELEETEILENENQQKRDPLETAKNEADEELETECLEATTTRPVTNLLNDVVDSIMEHWKNPIEIIVGVSDTLATETKNCKLQPGETKEEQEKRLLRNRLMKFKNRLLLKIERPDKAQLMKAEVTLQSRLRREKRLAQETPEETAARKQREHTSSISLRKRIYELETPEQKAERMAIDREKSRLRLHKKRATETPEERSARKKRQRDYQKNRRPQSLAMRTGKFYERHKQKLRQLENETN